MTRSRKILIGSAATVVALAAVLIGARAALRPPDDETTESVSSSHTMRGLFALDPGEDLTWTALAGAPDPPAHAVVLVHGLDEPGTIWDDLAPALRAAGHAVLRFEYPNDDAIADSADALAASLTELRSRGVTSIDLVCHSMGGLLARDVLTRAEYYGGHAGGSEGSGPNVGPVSGWRARAPGVERLIMLGTPNGGSPWAKVRTVAELRERFLRVWRTGDVLGAARWDSDGSGRAGDDLLPGSAYLEDLNTRPAPTGVRMTIVAGAISPVDASALREWADASLLRRLFGEQTEAVIDWAADLENGLGDGVVSLDSARLDGVEDFVVVEANHRFMVRRPDIVQEVRRTVGAEHKDPPAVAIVLDRLVADGKSGG